jgi:hypothetical protein
MRYRTGVTVALVIAVVLLVIGSSVGRGIIRSEQDAFERGARAVIMHARCRGGVPSTEYLQRAFRSGEPQSCADVFRLERSNHRPRRISSS